MFRFPRFQNYYGIFVFPHCTNVHIRTHYSQCYPLHIRICLPISPKPEQCAIEWLGKQGRLYWNPNQRTLTKIHSNLIVIRLTRREFPGHEDILNILQNVLLVR